MNDLELIKSKLDIVDVISSYVPSVQRAGSNFRAVCPFHSEKTPSFMINPTLQIFKCFGCGKGGDVVKFIQEVERVEFTEALKISAEKAGIQLTGRFAAKDSKFEDEKKRLIHANNLTAKFYNYILKTHSLGLPGREYAQKRKIDGKRIEDFIIGFAPNSSLILKTFLASKGFTDKELVKFGLLIDRDGKMIDKFRNRLLQPIFNVQGDVIAFSGRYIGTSKLAPKYLNSPETLVYKKNEILYGLYQAKEAIRKQNFVILVEGNIDILSSHRIQIENIVAPLGTAFTANQAKLIKRFAEEIYFCFDTDEAGTKALVRSIEIAETAGLKHKVINITGFQDADELICNLPSKWAVAIENASDSVEYLIRLYSSSLDLGTAQGKVKFRDEIVPVLNSIKDQVSLNHYIKEVASMVDVSPDIILDSGNSRKGKVVKPKYSKRQEDLSEVIESEFDDQTHRKQIKDEFFLAYLINFSDSKILKQISEGIFIDNSLNNILKILKTVNLDNDIGQIANSMPSNFKAKFSELALFDLPEGKEAREEFKKLYYQIMKRFFENQIKKIRVSLLTNDENEDTLIKLNELTKLLKQLEVDKSDVTFF